MAEVNAFDEFLNVVQHSQYFDAEDVTLVDQTRADHQAHVQRRIELDTTLQQTQTLLDGRTEELTRLTEQVPSTVKAQPPYQYMLQQFLDKQLEIQTKYNKLLKCRESMYGPYHNSPASSSSELQSEQCASSRDTPDVSELDGMGGVSGVEGDVNTSIPSIPSIPLKLSPNPSAYDHI